MASSTRRIFYTAECRNEEGGAWVEVANSPDIASVCRVVEIQRAGGKTVRICQLTELVTTQRKKDVIG